MESFNLTYEDSSVSSLLPKPKSISSDPNQKASALIRTSNTSPTRHQTVLFICFLVMALTLFSNPVSAGIDCFKCVSVNGDNPSCEDPFHNNYSVSILESPCMGGRKGRNGLFPATACIKLAGIYVDTGGRMLIRDCAVDSGTLTQDTELARMSHCGSLYFGGRLHGHGVHYIMYPLHRQYWNEFNMISNIKKENGFYVDSPISNSLDDTKESITVRGCALDSGTLTTDTEIIRMSHCGGFFFGERYVKGCLQSCDDADGCNSSSQPNFSLLIFSSLQMTIVLCLHFWSKIF